jgi:hypothetical protein
MYALCMLTLQVLTLTSEKGKGGQEIPIPVVTEVASYSRDYLPTYRERPVYVRGRGEKRFTVLASWYTRAVHAVSVEHHMRVLHSAASFHHTS